MPRTRNGIAKNVTAKGRDKISNSNELATEITSSHKHLQMVDYR